HDAGLKEGGAQAAAELEAEKERDAVRQAGAELGGAQHEDREDQDPLAPEAVGDEARGQRKRGGGSHENGEQQPDRGPVGAHLLGVERDQEVAGGAGREYGGRDEIDRKGAPEQQTPNIAASWFGRA